MGAYQFLVTLKDVTPKVWRRIAVPATLDFYDLHSIIQTSVGWTDSHLFNFSIVDPINDKMIEMVGDEESVQENFAMAQYYMKNPPKKDKMAIDLYQRFIRTQVLLARDVYLDVYVNVFTEFLYKYDFGDGWVHDVVMERVIEDYEDDFPKVLEGTGTCPPEDIGGPTGFDHFKLVMKDKEDPEHAHIKAWAKSQGYRKFNLARVNADLKEEWCIE